MARNNSTGTKKKVKDGKLTRNGRSKFIAYTILMLEAALEKSSSNREKGKIRNIIASKTHKMKLKVAA